MSYNQATIVGNLGGDVDVKYTQGGTSVAKFSVATTDKRKDASGTVQEKTTWHRVVAFGRLADVCGEYLSKGSQVLIVGKIENSSYEKDGQKHYTSEILADTMKMLGKREGGTSSSASHGGAPRQQRQAPANPADDFLDDPDIPFITNRSTY